MNERIKQLAFKAGMNVDDDKSSTYGKFAEKFAKLIIRECVLISRTSTDGFSAGQRMEQLAVQAAMNVVDDKFSTYGKFAKKFAQLIVRECVLISRTSTDGFSAGRRMQEHFEVEEK